MTHLASHGTDLPGHVEQEFEEDIKCAIERLAYTTDQTLVLPMVFRFSKPSPATTLRLRPCKFLCYLEKLLKEPNNSKSYI